MKKILALLSAAVMIFSVAGCVNKNEPETTTTADESALPSAEQAHSGVQAVQSQAAPTEETATVTAQTTTAPHTKRPTITQYTTRPTSPNHLTTRPTTTERTTIMIDVPTRTQRETTERTTKERPERTTTVKLEVVTTSKPLPSFSYGGDFSVADENGRSTVRIKSHTCTESDRGTYQIMLNVEILSHESAIENMYIAYNCYDKKGNRINEEELYCVVPLSAPGTPSYALATATLDTAKVEFSDYYN